MRKPTVWVSDQGRQKQDCTAIEAGQKLEISGLRKKRDYYLCSENKCTDQLCNYCTADLRLYFLPIRFVGFSMRQLIYQELLKVLCWPCNK